MFSTTTHHASTSLTVHHPLDEHTRPPHLKIPVTSLLIDDPSLQHTRAMAQAIRNLRGREMPCWWRCSSAPGEAQTATAAILLLKAKTSWCNVQQPECPRSIVAASLTVQLVPDETKGGYTCVFLLVNEPVASSGVGCWWCLLPFPKLVVHLLANRTILPNPQPTTGSY